MCAVGLVTAKIGPDTVAEAIKSVCDQKSQEITAKSISEVCIVENDCLFEQKVCGCECMCCSSAIVDLKGLKLSMTILETQLKRQSQVWIKLTKSKAK